MKRSFFWSQMAGVALIVSSLPAMAGTVFEQVQWVRAPQRTERIAHVVDPAVQGIKLGDTQTLLREKLATAAPPAPSLTPFAGRPNGALPITGANSTTESAAAPGPNLASSVKITWSRPPMEAIAEKARHEGVPIVHLWENSHALLHVGVNRRGVPGIYLVQKTR